METFADKKHRLPVFEKRFHELRDERGMSQAAFADFLGVSRPTVGLYENGDRIPDASVLQSIAQKCDVSSDWLLGLSGNRRYEYSDIGALLGFKDEAISKLINAKKRENIKSSEYLALHEFINNILDSPYGNALLLNMRAYRDTVAGIPAAEAEIEAHPKEHSKDITAAKKAEKYGYRLLWAADYARSSLCFTERAFRRFLEGTYGRVEDDGSVSFVNADGKITNSRKQKKEDPNGKH